MNCPKCNAAMETVASGGVPVDRCTACKGIWFDAHEMTILREKWGSQALDVGAVAVGEKMDKIRKIQCPRCNNPMIPMVDLEQRHIHYEACTVCYGVYLDAGEFKDIKEYTVSEYLRDLLGGRRKS